MKLTTAFARTSERLREGTNPGVRPRANGRLHFVTPARPPEEAPALARSLFPAPGLILLHEVLHTVNQQCRFTDQLQHWNTQHRPPRPAEQVFYTSLMAYGCNLGLTRLAHAIKHVTQATL